MRLWDSLKIRIDGRRLGAQDIVVVNVRIKPGQRYIAVIVVCGASFFLGLSFFHGKQPRSRVAVLSGLPARSLLGLLNSTVPDLVSWLAAIKTKLLFEAAVFFLEGYLPYCGCVPGGTDVPFLGLE